MADSAKWSMGVCSITGLAGSGRVCTVINIYLPLFSLPPYPLPVYKDLYLLGQIQHALPQVKMRKRDEIADDEDDDAVRTSVSQDHVIATLCSEELFLSTQYTVYSSPHISERSIMRRGGYGRSMQHIQRSQLSFTPPSWISIGLQGFR
jgi:hypothetical protein